MTNAVSLAQQASTGVSQGFKNRIINGAMVIDQRNAGASVTPAAGDYTLDRWNFSATQASKVTIQRNAGSLTGTNLPAGFTNYLGVTSTSAYSIGAGDWFMVNQAIEGFNAADLNFGNANAKTITLSFWVRSSLTGTFGGVINNDDNSRGYPFTYTISSANTWEQKSVTIAGDTGGTWTGATNGRWGYVRFGLGVGSTYSGTAGAWTSSTVFSATGATSVVGTNGATFYITGVQLEVGSTATSFDYRPYGTELQLCQRYYAKCTAIDGTSVFGGIGGITGIGQSGNLVAIVGTFPVTMRTGPSVSFTSVNLYDGSSATSLTSIAGGPWSSTTSFRADINVGASSANRPYVLYGTSSGAFVTFSSEL